MKLEIWDNLLGWLDCSQLTEEAVRKEAERCEVMYKVDGSLRSWKEQPAMGYNTLNQPFYGELEVK